VQCWHSAMLPGLLHPSLQGSPGQGPSGLVSSFPAPRTVGGPGQVQVSGPQINHWETGEQRLGAPHQACQGKLASHGTVRVLAKGKLPAPPKYHYLDFLPRKPLEISAQSIFVHRNHQKQSKNCHKPSQERGRLSPCCVLGSKVPTERGKQMWTHPCREHILPRVTP
jgi:hypothetical protein